MTVLTKETSPAFTGDVAAPPEEAHVVACQNFVPVTLKDAMLGNASEGMPALAPGLAVKANNGR